MSDELILKKEKIKKRKKIIKILVFICLIILLIIFITSSYKIISWYIDNKNINKQITLISKKTEIKEVSDNYL